MGIREFQSKNNLKPDGIVGKNTVKKIKEVFNLNVLEASHFLAQIDHETGGFKYSIENLNYSQIRLIQIFKKYFPSKEIAAEYAYKPEKIANRVYANRMGNGDSESGDGWRYRGAGSLQLTGYNNYKKFSKYINDSKVLRGAEYVAENYYLETAIWYFKANDIFKYCEDISESSIRKVTKAVNGGYNGLQHRIELTQKYYKILEQIQRDEDKQDNTNTSNTITSDDNNKLDNNSEETTANSEHPIRTQKGDNKKGCLTGIIGWLL